jgi:hypothetical protein
VSAQSKSYKFTDWDESACWPSVPTSWPGSCLMFGDVENDVGVWEREAVRWRAAPPAQGPLLRL